MATVRPGRTTTARSGATGGSATGGRLDHRDPDGPLDLLAERVGRQIAEGVQAGLAEGGVGDRTDPGAIDPARRRRRLGLAGEGHPVAVGIQPVQRQRNGASSARRTPVPSPVPAPAAPS